MNRLEIITQKVKDLYEAKTPTRTVWADWLYQNHVFVVVNNAKKLAGEKGANAELTQVAAMLHDIADTKMERHEAQHEAESLKMARELMEECGYTPEEITLVVDDAIALHSCHGDERPSSKEGLVLATADALAHLDTDFYIYATWARGKENNPLEEVKAWVLKKIERDFNNKVCFEDVREQTRPSYEMIKTLFSR